MQEEMQAKMFRNQKEMMLRQRQAHLAAQFAMGKERFLWYEVFYFTVAPLLIIGAVKNKNPQAVAPLFPLSFAYGYQYHMFRGNK